MLVAPLVQLTLYFKPCTVKCVSEDCKDHSRYNHRGDICSHPGTKDLW